MSHQTGSHIYWRDTYVGFCQYNEDKDDIFLNVTLSVTLLAGIPGVAGTAGASISTGNLLDSNNYHLVSDSGFAQVRY